MLDKDFERIYENTKKKSVWTVFFETWDDYNEKLIRYVRKVYGVKLRIQEAQEREKLLYVQWTLVENVEKIINVLGIEPIKRREIFLKLEIPDVIKQVCKNKTRFDTELSNQNVKKLVGKLQNTLYVYGKLSEKEQEETIVFRRDLSRSINLFNQCVMIYNDVICHEPFENKGISTLQQAIRSWNKLEERYRKAIIEDWEKELLSYKTKITPYGGKI